MVKPKQDGEYNIIMHDAKTDKMWPGAKHEIVGDDSFGTKDAVWTVHYRYTGNDPLTDDKGV